MPTAIMWFRRDLRLDDHPALGAAAADGSVVALFVLDPTLRAASGAPRLAFAWRCLRDLDSRIGGHLVVRAGRPEEVVPALVREIGATSVHISADYGPYGAERDRRVERALGEVPLVRTGSPYAVAPGRLTTAAGGGYRVYSPFYRAWAEHGWRAPASRVDVGWVGGIASDGVPPDADLGGIRLPEAGEAAALHRLGAFIDGPVTDYADARNEPGTAGTSGLSPYLKYGCIHPRTVLARLTGSESEERFRKEIAWRDFYADVMFRHPETVRKPLQMPMRGIRYDTGPKAERRFAAWAEGRTGYPIVDAGLRQLRSEAWMHNRVRMIVASFLVKDLHLDWRRGARHFMNWLVDGDLASNYGGWQWVAGTGTDPAPYFRVFNPVLQSRKVDPDGTYIRRYVPELAAVAAQWIHEPWRLPAGPPNGYPLPIVDHAEERAEALRRYAEVKG